MDIEQQPSINVFGIRIDEPVTTLTDMLVAIVCFIAFYQLSRRKLPGRTQLFFRYYFLTMGISTFIGGLIGHAFLYYFSFAWKLPGWIISMISVALIERASIEHARPHIKPGLGKFFLVANILELVTIMTVTMITLNFRWVTFHSGYGMLAIVAPFNIWVYYKTRDRGSLIVIAAVAIASVAALFFINKISLNTWFNYLDISHSIMVIAGCVFYQGALKLNETKQ